MSQRVHGNLVSLGALDRAGLSNLYRLQTPAQSVVGDTLGRQMCALAAKIGRQIGVLIDRNGKVTQVVVGDHHKLWLPDIGRLRTSVGRLRGVRLVHVHLAGEALTADDLTDLARLGLDLVVALTLRGDLPDRVFIAHIVPTRPGEVIRDVRPHFAADPLAWPAHEFDAAATIRDIEGQLAREKPTARLVDARERALLVHVGDESKAEADDRLGELAELARTARVEVLSHVVQRRPQLDPKTVLGSGRLEQVVLEAMQLEASMLIFDHELSPSQIRGIARTTEMKVIDRTQLILDIFASRARTREGAIKVELAQLSYQLPRLSERDDALSRLTGGIGGVGPGETKLEVDRRRCRERIAKLRGELKRFARSRVTRRRRRSESDNALVVLLGYTNVGKSSLLNALTKADIFTENLLFATLAPTSRRLHLGDGTTVVMTDTVGFIRDLPKPLLGAFDVTLEEAREADVLLLVADAAHPQLESQLRSVEKILHDHELADKPRLLVLNKCDAVHDPAAVRELSERHGAVLVSAQARTGLGDLTTRLGDLILQVQVAALDAVDADASREREEEEAWPEDAQWSPHPPAEGRTDR